MGKKIVVVGFSIFLSGFASAGKIDPAMADQWDCHAETNTVSSQDGTKSLGTANFCVPKAASQMSVVGEKRQGFGNGVTGVTPGFIPAAGDSGYGVMPGEEYFWTWNVNVNGAGPAIGTLVDRFPINADVISAHYVKGALPGNQLPWAQVIASMDASVKFALPANNAEVVVDIMQAPAGPGYVVLVLKQKNPGATTSTTAPATQ